MADPIEAHYTPDGDDWTVAVTGRGRTLTGRAPELLAARDRADQLVEELAPGDSEVGHRTVVHLLNGDAVDFTTAYLTAQLARNDDAKTAAQAADDQQATAEETEADAAAEEPAGQESDEDTAEDTPEQDEAAAPAEAEAADDEHDTDDDESGEGSAPAPRAAAPSESHVRKTG